LKLQWTTKTIQKKLWQEKYKTEVKAVSPELLRSKKRGKRAGHRCKLRGVIQNGRIRINLPSIFLTNTNSLINKIEELEARITTHSLLKNTCLIAITETWLTSNVTDSQLTISDDYIPIRQDRQIEKTGKSKGGGLLIYLNKLWCNSYKVVSSHCEPNLEMMGVLLRPFWTPREIASIVVLLVYCPVFGPAASTTVKETVKSIHLEIDNLERKYPSSTIMVMGDFNSCSVNLSKYQQYVTCTTRNDKMLDKCYINKNVSYKCARLPPLGKSDHDSIFLYSSYNPHHDCNRKIITKQIWSSENMEKLLTCMEMTD
jgi:hypothetical protein